MAERYEVAVKIISQEGTCAQGHKVGDEWVIREKTPEGICLAAYNILYPEIRVMMFGGSFPWENDPDVTTLPCKDRKNPVVFELRKLRK